MERKIICGECGAFYGPKVWHSTSKYKRTIWQCNRKFKNGNRCSTPHLYEDEIKAAFDDVMNRMIQDKDAIIADYKVIIDQLTDTTTLDEEERRLKDEAEIVLEMINRAVVENASKALDQAEFSRRYEELVSKFEAKKAKIDDINEQRTIRQTRRNKLADFSIFLQRDRLISNFDEKLRSTLECIKVDHMSQLTFIFESGHQIISGHQR